MTSPLKRIESHPHEAKRLMVLSMTNFSFSCSIWTKTHTNKQSWKHKIRIIAKGGGHFWNFTQGRRLSLFSIFEAKADFEILGLLFDISKTKAILLITG